MFGTRKIVGMSTAFAVAMVITVGIGANTASADDYGETFRNGDTQGCLEDDMHTNLIVNMCNPGWAGQAWDVHKWNDGTVRLQNEMTKRCIRVYNPGVNTAACDASQAESFQVWDGWGDGGIALISQSTGLCLDDSSDFGLRVFTCENFYGGQESPYQTWY